MPAITADARPGRPITLCAQRVGAWAPGACLPGRSSGGEGAVHDRRDDLAMVNRAKALWLNVSQSLGFIPGFIVVLFAVLGIVLVEIDGNVDLDGVQVVFQGDGSAARTVLSVIAGSLITVAGLTFSITMVVLQLASSQFSPRILRTFFGDRMTQITIGTYVGTFVYAILVLRAVGSFDDAGFVPRLSVTVASLLGIAAVVLLIVFLHHVSQMVQVSHVAANIAHATLARTDVLYPDGYETAMENDGGTDLLDSWRSDEPGRVLAPRPGYVQRVGLDDLVKGVSRRAERVAILVCPGDFVSIETPIAEIWPAEAADDCRHELLGAVSIASERDLHQDVDFGVRQLADTALKSMSPGINDPATAVTCIGYLRAILVCLTERAPAAGVRRFPDQDLAVMVRERHFDEYLEVMLQINRYVDGDAWVIGEMLRTLQACARTARRCGAHERMRTVHSIAMTIAEQATNEVKNERDLGRIKRLRAEIRASEA